MIHGAFTANLLFACPLCGQAVSRTEWSLKTHLTAHLRRGEISQDELHELFNQNCNSRRRKDLERLQKVK